MYIDDGYYNIGEAKAKFFLTISILALLSIFVIKSFDGSILTNAHCEILTSLINLGIIGTIIYITIFFISFVRCIKYAEKKPCYISQHFVLSAIVQIIY